MSLSNSQYQKIARDYEETRRRNRDLLEERREQVYTRIPEFRDLDESRNGLISRRIHSLMAEDSGTETSSDQEAFRRIFLRRRDLLRTAGFPEDYLDPIYTCPDCQDTGYCLTEDGTREKCRCFRKQEIEILYEQSNLQGILATDTFSRLSYAYCKTEDDLEHLRGAVRISQDFAAAFPEGKNILFYGTVGTGKSFLSGCIANELLQKGHSVVYFSAVSLFETLARYSFSNSEKESLYNFCKDLYNYDLVVVDDLGTEVTNSFVASQLFSLLNDRVMRGKSTIISTNLNLGELRDRYSERVFSRITRSFTICLLTGPDVRMCQKLNAMS